MDNANPAADAFVVENNKFAFVGTEADARKFLGDKKAEETDLGGKLVVPGLNDSHLHFVHFAKSMRSVSLFGVKSLAELKSRMKEGLAARKPGDVSWLEGEGWNNDYFEDETRFPNKKDLDEISADVPMIAMRTCFHVAALNSAAMKEIGLSKETAASFGDMIETDANGEPNGVIKEKLLDKTKKEISTLTRETLKEILIDAQETALAQGLTSVQSDDFSYVPNSNYKMLFGVFKELEDEGKMRIRLAEQCLIQSVSAIEKFHEEGYHAGWGTDKIRVACIKLLSDGSLGARTAATRKPYADDPATEGLMLFTQEELNDLVMTSHKKGYPAAIHAIGDRAIEMALNAIENAQKAIPAPLRHGVVHAQITDKTLLERFAKLHALAYVQPIFIDYDMNIVADRVGKETASTSYAWKTMIDLGVPVSFGTDCPVESFNTMPNIYTAVSRKNVTGDRREFLPEQKVSMHKAIRAYTVEGAYATNEEDKKGAITAGMLADFIVLSRDLFRRGSDEEILETQVLKTYVDGKLEYERK